MSRTPGLVDMQPLASPLPVSEPFVRLARWSLAAGISLALILTLVLLLRRLGGALTASLPGPGVILVVAVAAALATLVRLATASTTSLSGRATRMVLPSLAIVGVIYAVSSAATPLWAAIVAWVAAAGEELAWWTHEFLRSRNDGIGRPADSTATVATNTVEPPGVDDYDPDAQLPEQTTQQITRTRDEAGHEYLFGRVRSDFAAGERSQNVHLAFCPPLDAPPQVLVEQTEGPDVTIKVAQAETFGSRLELRLASFAEESQTVVLQFEVRTAEQDVT